MQLRSNLIEHFDYEVISPDVWKHLYSWYSADMQVVRKLKRDYANQLVVDLYPKPTTLLGKKK